ncbi:hypothetical protein [Actinoallomurus soli]|uniref:hypothetical protein n=1 Tax=Actinoallomurus soli TaxID=2952535 RepID=UPI002093E3B4|nr:hypothetical protein [Actinoallomurus soli]MCO5972975.1 hypothetical protein [Actinoallomurus soli]
MPEVIDYGRFAERLRRVMPRWDDRDRMSPAAFAEHLADTGPRWELLRVFQEEWGYEPPGGEPRWPRWSESEHEAYVRRLKAEGTDEEDGDEWDRVDLTLPVPAALDEWWDLPFNSFTYRPRLYWTNPEWPPTVRPDPTGYGVSDGLPPGNPFVGPDDDHRVCVFKAEYQYCNEWGYLAAEAALPDPKVLVSTGDGWVVQARSISEFFLQLAVTRLPAHYGWTVRLYDPEPELVDRVRRDLPELGLLPWRELGADTLAYGALDAIVYLDDGGLVDFPLVVHARTRTALEDLARTLGADWADEIESPEADRPDPKDQAEPAEPEPLSLRVGQTDADGRWTVEAVSDRPLCPPEPEPPAVLTGAARPAGLTVWAADPDVGVVAGDQAGGLHVWPPARPATAAGAAAPAGADASVDAVTPPGAEVSADTDAEVPVAPLSRTAHDAPVTAVACRYFDGPGDAVLSGDAAGQVYVWPSSGEGDPVPVGIGRRGGKVVALGIESLETGPAMAAVWSTGAVWLWDYESGLDAVIHLGPGIETLILEPEGVLTVGGPTGTATVRLDPERLWPKRDLHGFLRRFEWEELESARGPATDFPERILRMASDDAEVAEEALNGLPALLIEGEKVFPATVATVPFLVLLATEAENHVRGPLLSLVTDIARAVSGPVAAGEQPEEWAGNVRLMIVNLLPAVAELLDGSDPGVREAARRLLAEFPDEEARSERE